MTAVAARGRVRPVSPFKGLAPFDDTELDELLFFGREREAEIVVANLVASRLTVLYGTSGVGKSSLLRAAVVRRLRALPEQPLVVLHDSWTAEPARAVGDALAGAAGVDAELAPTDAAEVAASVRGEVYLVLDQVDELFVYHGDPAVEAFGRALGDVVARGDLPVHVLLGIREDALARLDAFKGRIPGLLANRLRLDHLDREAGRLAIVGPVERFGALVPEEEGLAVEPELVEAVLDGVRAGDVVGRGRGVAKGASATERVETPYLQLVMQRLWEVERAEGSRALRLATLDRLGGPRHIVEEHLERALAALTPVQKMVAARMFNHLVTPSGTKIAHGDDDLARYASTSERELEPILSTLGRERIVRTVSAGNGLAHEIYHDVLADAVLAWRGRFEAEQALEEERAAARRRHRRLLAVIAVAALGLVVLGAVALYALAQRRDARSQADTSRGRALAAEALAQLPVDPERSLLLARAAARDTSGAQVENVLRQALIASRVRAVTELGSPVATVGFRGPHEAVAVTDGGRIVTIDARDGRVVQSFGTRGGTVALAPRARVALAYGVAGATWYRTSDGRALGALAAPPVRSVRYSLDGARAVTLHGDRTLRIWRTGDPQPLRSIILPAAPTGAAVSHTRALVAAATGGRVTLVFETSSGRLLRRLRQPSVVAAIAFAPAGRLLLLTVGEDRAVRLFDPLRGSLRKTLVGHAGTVLDAGFGPRGDEVATASSDGTARVWGLSGDGGAEWLLSGHGNIVTGVAFSPNGTHVVTTSADRTARVWTTTGQALAVLAGHRDSVESVSFGPGGGAVATASRDGTVRFWDPQAQPILARVEGLETAAAARFAGDRIVVAPPGAADVATSADGSWGTAAGRQVVVHGPDGSVSSSFRAPASATGIALSPDAQTLALGFRRGVARLFDTHGRVLRVLHGGRGTLLRMSFSPDGALLAAGSTDDTAKIWDVPSGVLVHELRGHAADVLSARFSSDGTRVVTASQDHDAFLWSVSSGARQVVLRAHFGRVADAAFSPDGNWVVTAGPGKAGLFDARSGSLVFYLRGHTGPLTSASFGPDGRRILTSGVDGTVRSWTCDVCGGLDELEALADRRLAATGRRLTAEERALYVP